MTWFEQDNRAELELFVCKYVVILINVWKYVYVSQGAGNSSEFPRICQSIQMQQRQLHGPWKHVSCVVIHRPLARGLLWGGSSHPQTASPPCECRSTHGGYGDAEAPLSSLLDVPSLVDWYCSMHFLLKESSGLYPHGQTEHCHSDSDTVVHLIGLIILLLTDYNQSFFPLSVFIRFSSGFIHHAWVCRRDCECDSAEMLSK